VSKSKKKRRGYYLKLTISQKGRYLTRRVGCSTPALWPGGKKSRPKKKKVREKKRKEDRRKGETGKPGKQRKKEGDKLTFH